MSLESQHWYTRTGEPAHFQDGGGPTTLREARKQNLCPSVSTVLSIIAKPQLERWKRQQSVLAALTLGRMSGEPDSAYLARIDADGRRQAQEAAEEGTAIHAALEAMFAGSAVPPRFRAHCGAVRTLIHDNWPNVTDWKSEHRFAHSLGFGGCVDLHSPSAGIVLDFKSTDIAPDQDKQLAYDQHWQLGGYALGLKMEDAIGGNIFVSRTHPGHVRYHQWTAEKMRAGEYVFIDTLRLWKSLKQFDGGW